MAHVDRPDRALKKPMSEVTQDDYARVYGTVTAADGSVWVRQQPKERIAETVEDIDAIEERLPDIPVLFDLTE